MVALAVVLNFAFAEGPTFTKDVYPLIRSKCMPCHTTGGAGPFSLGSYPDVKRRLELIRTVLLARSMPPYRAEGVHLPITPLTDQELVTVQKWMQGGALEGPKEVYAQPSIKALGAGWASPKMPLRADGLGYWVSSFLPNPHRRAVNLRDIGFTPRTPGVVRQVVVSVATKNMSGLFGDYAGLPVGAWAPGFGRIALPGTVTIPKGGGLMVQVFAIPSGKVEDAGIDFWVNEDLRVRPDMKSKTLRRQDLRVDWKDSLTAQAEWTVPEDVVVSEVIPTARYFAASFSLQAQVPGQEAQDLTAIPVWNRNWVPPLRLKPPARLRAGTKVTATFRYANDEYCTPRQADIAQPVLFGAGLFKECFRVDLQYLRARELSRWANVSNP